MYFHYNHYFFVATTIWIANVSVSFSSPSPDNKCFGAQEEWLRCTETLDTALTNNNQSIENDLEILCTFITNKASCYEVYARRCLSPEGIRNIRLRFLLEQVDIILHRNKKIELLECPILVNFQFEIMLYATGTLKCTFQHYFTRLRPQHFECMRRAFSQWNSQSRISNFLRGSNKSYFLKNLACKTYHLIQHDCHHALTDECFLPEEAEKLKMEQFHRHFQEMELKIESNIDPTFKFRESCNGSFLNKYETESEIEFNK